MTTRPLHADFIAPAMTKVFIAFPYRAAGQEIVDSIIRPALFEQGFIAVTGPHERTDDVVSTIRASISDSAALIAVVAGANPNVFFEIGIASGLGKRCLLIAASAAELAMLDSTYPSVLLGRHESSQRQLREHLRTWRGQNGTNIERTAASDQRTATLATAGVTRSAS